MAGDRDRHRDGAGVGLLHLVRIEPGEQSARLEEFRPCRLRHQRGEPRVLRHSLTGLEQGEDFSGDTRHCFC